MKLCIIILLKMLALMKGKLTMKNKIDNQKIHKAYGDFLDTILSEPINLNDICQICSCIFGDQRDNSEGFCEHVECLLGDMKTALMIYEK